MSSGLGGRSPEEVMSLKVKKATEGVKAYSGAHSGRTRCSEHPKVWDSLAYCREL